MSDRPTKTGLYHARLNGNEDAIVFYDDTNQTFTIIRRANHGRPLYSRDVLPVGMASWVEWLDEVADASGGAS